MDRGVGGGGVMWGKAWVIQPHGSVPFYDC